jgi:predicted nucleic acid-binding protein
LVKLFVAEPESDALNEALAGLTDVIVSDLALTEMASALGRRMREQQLTRDSTSLARCASSCNRTRCRSGDDGVL